MCGSNVSSVSDAVKRSEDRAREKRKRFHVRHIFRSASTGTIGTANGSPPLLSASDGTPTYGTGKTSLRVANRPFAVAEIPDFVHVISAGTCKRKKNSGNYELR